MPLYRYRCNQCGHEFSERQRFSDDPLTDCPVCSGEIRRVINSVGIVFKGSGFYVTDNRNGSSPTASRRSTDAGSGETSSAGESKESSAPAKEKKKAESASSAGAKASAS